MAKYIWRYVYSFRQNVRTYQTDGHTDGRTDTAWRHRPRCIASRGKNTERPLEYKTLPRLLRAAPSNQQPVVMRLLQVSTSGVARPLAAGADVTFAALPSLEILESLFNPIVDIFLSCTMHSFLPRDAYA